MIIPPRSINDYPDRDVDCQEAMESRIGALIDEARAVGWSVDDVTAALIELADNYWLKMRAIEETEQTLAGIGRTR